MSKVHILVNSFSARLGGGQTYLINLLNTLKESDDIKITLLAAKNSPWQFNNKNIQVKVINFPVENPFLRYLWEITMLPQMIKTLKPDIMFWPGGIISIFRIEKCKIVTMFRNMMPFDEVQINKYAIFSLMRLRLRLLNYLMLKSMESADLVIFISNYAKNVIDKTSSKGIKKSVIIPHGVGANFHNDINTNSNEDAYILYPSTFDMYKSQLEVVEAYSGLYEMRKEDTPLLYLVGSGEKEYKNKVMELVKEKKLEHKIKFLGQVPYAEMPRMYKNANMIIFASQTENCPNILLESMAAGKPIVCSNLSPMPEFGGDAVLYFDPRDPKELTITLNNLIDDEKRKQELAHKAFERSKNYSWEKCTEKTWNEFRNIVNRG